MDIKAILLSKPALNIGLMLSLKYFDIDPPLHPTRVLCAICLTLHCILLGLLYRSIITGPEGKRFKAKEVDNEAQKCALCQLRWAMLSVYRACCICCDCAALLLPCCSLQARGSGTLIHAQVCRVVVKSYTWKSYDETLVVQQARTVAMSMAVTIAMHMWRGFKAPLLAACLQPFFVLTDPVFQTRVLGMDKEVIRPVPDPMKKCVCLTFTTADKSSSAVCDLELVQYCMPDSVYTILLASSQCGIASCVHLCTAVSLLWTEASLSAPESDLTVFVMQDASSDDGAEASDRDEGAKEGNKEGDVTVVYDLAAQSSRVVQHESHVQGMHTSATSTHKRCAVRVHDCNARSEKTERAISTLRSCPCVSHP